MQLPSQTQQLITNTDTQDEHITDNRKSPLTEKQLHDKQSLGDSRNPDVTHTSSPSCGQIPGKIYIGLMQTSHLVGS